MNGCGFGCIAHTRQHSGYHIMAVLKQTSSSFAALLLVLAWLGSEVRGQSRQCESDTMQVTGRPCTSDLTSCEFSLEVEYKQTMRLQDADSLFADNYNLYRYNDTQKTTPIPNAKLWQEVVVGDGWTPARLVTVINGSMPGPCLVLYVGQQVTVKVFNKLPSESLTIHWHGLLMRNNAYNDGVAFVTQCPILPGQSFTYNFKVDNKGTNWYHSHIGSQRTMGILGALIVREKTVLPRDERVLVIQDWNHDFTSDQMELGVFLGSGSQQQSIQRTESLDGGFFSSFDFQSGLINGRGRYYGKTNGMTVMMLTPLDIIEVDKDKEYRFRVIAAGALYPFRVAIEGHRMSVVASDGWDFSPVPAESFVVNPGERYDFILSTNMTGSKDYLIYAETLEVNLNGPSRHVAEAVLRYAGAPNSTVPPALPSNRGCSAQSKCVVVNCPYTYYPTLDHTVCVHLDQLLGTTPAPTATPKELIEIFLNFGFPGTGGNTLSSINGIKFIKTPVAAILHAKDPPAATACNKTCGLAQEPCTCAHTVTLARDSVHQLVLLNMGSGQGFAHPIHIHGYDLYVVKMGYPSYDNTSGKFIEVNKEIDCQGNVTPNQSYCNTARWANETWRAENGGEVPLLNLQNPIRKDTIIVPTGGYVVVRLKADNPGMWFVHCHIEMHHLTGMALMLNVSASSLPPPPKGFPTCDNYPPGPNESEVSASATSQPLTFLTFGALLLSTGASTYSGTNVN